MINRVEFYISNLVIIYFGRYWKPWQGSQLKSRLQTHQQQLNYTLEKPLFFNNSGLKTPINQLIKRLNAPFPHLKNLNA